jgi:hypothetical protein
VGCHDRAEARVLVIERSVRTDLGLRSMSEPYDDAGLMADFDHRCVPERDFIRLTFLPRPSG